MQPEKHNHINIINQPRSEIMADYAGQQGSNHSREINVIPNLELIDLGLGHSPWGAPKKIVETLINRHSSEILNRIEQYPSDRWSAKLAQLTRQRFNLSEETHVSFQPGGSYRILANILTNLIDWTPKKEAGIITPGLCFPNIALLVHQLVPQNKKQEFPFKALDLPINTSYDQRIISLAQHRQQDPLSKVVYLDLPNNPTGATLEQDSLTAIAEATLNKNNPDLLIIDEAYGDTININAISLAQQYPHIIITRSVSKTIGLAGMRIGYAIVSPGQLSELYKKSMDLVFDVGGLDQLILQQTLQPEILNPHLKQVKNKIFQVKTHLIDQLHSLGLNILPTDMNVPILLAQAPHIPNFASFLARYGIIIESGSDFKDVCSEINDSYVRIRTPKDIQTVNIAMQRIQNAIQEAQENPEACWLT